MTSHNSSKNKCTTEVSESCMQKWLFMTPVKNRHFSTTEVITNERFLHSCCSFFCIRWSSHWKWETADEPNQTRWFNCFERQSSCSRTFAWERSCCCQITVSRYMAERHVGTPPCFQSGFAWLWWGLMGRRVDFVQALQFARSPLVWGTQQRLPLHRHGLVHLKEHITLGRDFTPGIGTCYRQWLALRQYIPKPDGQCLCYLFGNYMLHGMRGADNRDNNVNLCLGYSGWCASMPLLEPRWKKSEHPQNVVSLKSKPYINAKENCIKP